jgi:hypothetical protein
MNPPKSPETQKVQAHLNGVSPPIPADKPDQELASILADHQWIHQQYNAGSLEPYAGEFIAVFEQQIVAHDARQEEVRVRASQQLPGVPAQRFAVSYIEKWD